MLARVATFNTLPEEVDLRLSRCCERRSGRHQGLWRDITSVAQDASRSPSRSSKTLTPAELPPRHSRGALPTSALELTLTTSSSSRSSRSELAALCVPDAATLLAPATYTTSRCHDQTAPSEEIRGPARLTSPFTNRRPRRPAAGAPTVVLLSDRERKKREPQVRARVGDFAEARRCRPARCWHPDSSGCERAGSALLEFDQGVGAYVQGSTRSCIRRGPAALLSAQPPNRGARRSTTLRCCVGARPKWGPYPIASAIAIGQCGMRSSGWNSDVFVP